MNPNKLFHPGAWVGKALAGLALVSLSGCVVYVRPRPTYYYTAPAPAPAPVVAAPAPETQLQQLVAPIALYPDPLLAVVLPASTFPDQVQQANAFVQSNPNAPQPEIDAQPWDASVKALVHYPTVLTYMNGDIAWTQSLGAAFTNDQADVEAAIQDLRAQARAEGNLNSTAQMDVVVDGPQIALVPTDPAFIYVPVYDPMLVYYQPYSIRFGVGFVAGGWLNFGFDWGHHGFFVGDWRGGWIHDGYGWHHDPHFVRPAYYHAWARDTRWGPAPRFSGHYAVRADMRGHDFHPAPVHAAGAHYGAHPADHHDDHHDEHGR